MNMEVPLNKHEQARFDRIKRSKFNTILDIGRSEAGHLLIFSTNTLTPDNLYHKFIIGKRGGIIKELQQNREFYDQK